MKTWGLFICADEAGTYRDSLHRKIRVKKTTTPLTLDKVGLKINVLSLSVKRPENSPPKRDKTSVVRPGSILAHRL